MFYFKNYLIFSLISPKPSPLPKYQVHSKPTTAFSPLLALPNSLHVKKQMLSWLGFRFVYQQALYMLFQTLEIGQVKRTLWSIFLACLGLHSVSFEREPLDISVNSKKGGLKSA